MNIKQSFSESIRDRSFIFVWSVVLLLVIAVVVLGAIYIRPSDLQVPIRYSSFGITNFYRDKWYYLLSFVFFAIILGVIHTGISLRLRELKGRLFSLAFLWLTAIILLVTAVTLLALFRVVTLSQ